jgi:hypothetical protein
MSEPAALTEARTVESVLETNSYSSTKPAKQPK